MSELWNLNLILFFEFYLAITFAFSTANRVWQYRAALALLRRLPSRWPRLLQEVAQHRGLFLTWATLLPALLALTLIGVQMVLSRLVWPKAAQSPDGLTLERLWDHSLAVPCVGLDTMLMLAVDVTGIFWVGQIDQQEMEKYFDQAEYWLRSWTAPVLRTVTFGIINPRRMVALEVQKALVSFNALLNFTLWWVIVQTGLRIGCGLALWLTYALTRPA